MCVDDNQNNLNYGDVGKVWKRGPRFAGCSMPFSRLCLVQIFASMRMYQQALLLLAGAVLDIDIKRSYIYAIGSD
jgi:hypothetical protein